MKFTLVSTVFNEMSRLETSISDIEAQTILPDEIIITDAGSNDGTYERLLRWQIDSKIEIKILQEKGCNIARGRNMAISASSNSIIASTDFGCRFHKKWLESIIMPFDGSNIDVVGGNFSVRENEIHTMAARADYILQNGFNYPLDSTFSVSSRSIAYKKRVWEQIGGYKEILSLAADDTIFWRQIKSKNFSYKLVDKQYVYWGRHKCYIQFAKESGRYGLGDGESGINFRNFCSMSMETIMRYLLFLSFVLLLYSKAFDWYLILCFPLLFGLRSYFKAIVKWLKFRSAKYNLAVLFSCFWLIELNRFYYISSYIKAWGFQRKKFRNFQKELGVA
jgi:glycosyltransferase involved in cell wall biosynthesis